MTALHQFGAEMLKLSRGLESFAPVTEISVSHVENSQDDQNQEAETDFESSSESKHQKIAMKK